MIRVRMATAADADRIWQINRDALGYDFPLERTRERVAMILASPSNHIAVACDETDRVIGYLHGADYENTYSESMKNILALAVDPRVQGCGAGRLLLDDVQRWASACGCEAVRLVSGHNRTAAHAFYEHCGYTLRKEQKNFIKYL